jgi:demethylmenaquinone methyltransferase/2-methoxy-6-polyprenyl-1,4-benzoquinol methylase
MKNIIEQQIQYYRDRSTEYDEWFLRLGRYDKGETINNLWFSEVKQLVDILDQFNAQGDVLELACGTGWWTEQLVRYANTITAVDASSEVMDINRSKLSGNSCPINYEQHDLFTWQPDRKFDIIFFSFWLSHVPPELLDSFLDKIRISLKKNGRIFFIDSLPNNIATAHDQTFDKDNHINKRKINNGKEYDIIKVFYEPNELQRKFLEHGMKMSISKTANYFIYGRSDE